MLLINLIILFSFVIYTEESAYNRLNISIPKEKDYQTLEGVYEKTNKIINNHVYYKKLVGEGYVYVNKYRNWVVGSSLDRETLRNDGAAQNDPPEKGWSYYDGGGTWRRDSSIRVKRIKGNEEGNDDNEKDNDNEDISQVMNYTKLLKERQLTNISIFAAGCGGAVIALEFLCLVLCVYFYKKRKNKREMKAILEIEANNKDVNTSFPHVLLVKGASLKADSAAYAAAIDNLKMEFRLLVRYVERNVPPNLSCSDASEEDVNSHNKYKDILPFNHNRIVLSKPLGEPPTTYINASKITFYGLKQEFLAVQAPKTNSIQNFWQLVIDKQVGIIVMITGLKEGGRTKATQYWPDKDNTAIEFANCKVKYESHTYPGTYFHRKLSLDAGDGTRTVDHLQTTAWMDRTAPTRSKILLDLVYKTQELVEERPGPILVHCSAGVGRTGTFMALYKLADDYSNENVQVLDIANTVLEMRRQRVKMVQKKEQYAYIAKCLSHYISAQEAEYQLA